MRRFLLITFLSFTSIFLQAQTLSSDAKISLITIAPGDALYESFGHSVMRVYDPAQGLDMSFNYGNFDFRTEGFYIKFIRGQLPYQLLAYDFNQEVFQWNYFHRQAVEQVLNISQPQKQAIFDYLQNNYLPQNREYFYKFFYDNCSTRLRDVVQKVVADSLRFDKSLHADSSYRDWINKYSIENKKTWANFGMDLALGMPADEKTGWNGAMFIPFNLEQGFDKAEIFREGKWQKLVAEKRIVNPIKRVPPDEIITSTTFFWIFFIGILLLTIIQLMKKNSGFVFDKILLTIVGLAGWLIVFLWFFTNHGVTERNLNIIWAIPLLFPLVWFISSKNQKKWQFFLFLDYFIILTIFLFVMNFTPQTFNEGIIPLVLALAVRAFYIWWKTRNWKIKATKE